MLGAIFGFAVARIRRSIASLPLAACTLVSQDRFLYFKPRERRASENKERILAKIVGLTATFTCICGQAHGRAYWIRSRVVVFVLVELGSPKCLVQKLEYRI